ncbi:MAG: flotillin family protein [Armatimonadetes bacterium]|nr:flotillin family protein [Armatimonadota bacterium]
MDLIQAAIWTVGGLAGILFVVFILISIYSRLYRTAGPNEVLVISGGNRGMRLVRGGGSLINPFTEKVDRFSLENVTIEIVTPEVYTLHGVPIIVDAVAQVKVKNDEEAIQTAVERFLSKSSQEIREVLKQTLEGHTRAILGQMSVENIITARDEFAQTVTRVSLQDLSNMGFGIDSFSIKDIRDTQGYLSALGKPQTAEIKKKAAIAEAEAARDAQKAAALANQEAEIAKIDARTKIAEKDRDFRMQQADYNKSSKAKEAEADLAYELQKNRTQQQVIAEEVQIQIIQKEKEIEVQEKETIRKERELQATIVKPADARRYEIEALANAEQFKLKTTAEGQSEALKLNGFAKAEVVEREGKAQAEANKQLGIAQADVARAQGLANADVVERTGVAEGIAMAKKADSWRAYNEAAILQMLIEKLPEIAGAVTAPLAKTERIVMIGGGDGVGISKFTGDVTKTVAQLPAVLEALTGLKFEDLVKNVPSLAMSKGNGAPNETPT